MKELRINEKFNEACPSLSIEEFQKLEDLIIKDGFVRYPILIWNDVIIDGHNRYAIAKKHRLEFTTNDISFESDEEAIVWIKENAISQRNLNDYQRAKLVLELEDYYKSQAKERQIESGKNYGKGKQKSAEPINNNSMNNLGQVRDKLAEKAGVSHDTISKVKFIDNNAIKEIKEQLEAGEISINKAFNETKEPKNEISLEVKILESAAKSLCRWVNKNSGTDCLLEFIPSISNLIKKIRKKKTKYAQIN